MAETFNIDLSKVSVGYDGDFIVIDGKRMRVEHHHEYTFKCMKTKILHAFYSSLPTAAASLAETVKKWISEAMSKAEGNEVTKVGSVCFMSFEANWALTIIKHVKQYGKEKV